MTPTYTPTHARAHLFDLIRQVNEQRQPVAITPANGGPGAVILAADDWAAIEETLYLEATGTLAAVRQREQDDSGFTTVDEIDWDAL